MHEVTAHSDVLPSSEQWGNVTAMVNGFCRQKYRYDPQQPAQGEAEQRGEGPAAADQVRLTPQYVCHFTPATAPHMHATWHARCLRSATT